MALALGSWQSISSGTTKVAEVEEVNVLWRFSGLVMQTATTSIGPAQRQRTSAAWHLAIASHLDFVSPLRRIPSGQSLSTVLVKLHPPHVYCPLFPKRWRLPTETWAKYAALPIPVSRSDHLLSMRMDPLTPSPANMKRT